MLYHTKATDTIDGVTWTYYYISIMLFNRDFTFIISFKPLLVTYNITENVVTQWDVYMGMPRVIYSGHVFGWNVPKELRR